MTVPSSAARDPSIEPAPASETTPPARAVALHAIPGRREEELYLGNHGIYVSHYHGSTSSYVVIAPPLFEELSRTRKILVNAGRMLADAGHHVVRFDYRSTGLSHGSFTKFSLNTATHDLASVIDYCRSKGATTISLFGFRFGAYLVAAALDPSIHRAILWEPVTDLSVYASEMLRVEVANQMVTFGKVIATREQLVEKLRKAGSVLVDGYQVGLPLYEQFTAAPRLSLEQLARSNDRIKLVFWDNKKLHATASALPMASTLLANVRFSWKQIRFLDPRPEQLLEETTEWLGAA
jgi:alpha/beta superfamily hydrolase